jgi:hypothetical protein
MRVTKDLIVRPRPASYRWSFGSQREAGKLTTSARRGRHRWERTQDLRRSGRRALLLRLFDRGANLRRDIGTGPPSYGEQSFRDGACAFDDNRFGIEHGAQAFSAPKRRRLVRSDRHGRFQTGELGFGEDKLDHESPVRYGVKRQLSLLGLGCEMRIRRGVQLARVEATCSGKYA